MQEGKIRERLIETQNSPEYQENVGALIDYLSKESAELRSKGVPVAEDMRISVAGFPEFTPEERAADLKKIEDESARQARASDLNNVRPEIAKYNEQFEMLTTAIFQKNLGDKYIVVRASKYDDFFGGEAREGWQKGSSGVDLMLVNLETGRPICAIDDVPLPEDPATMRDRLVEKQRKVAEINANFGAKLKYGLKLDGKGKNKKLVCGKVEDVPVFYLALPRERVAEGVSNFEPDTKKSRGYEQSIYKALMTMLLQEIAMMELSRKDQKRLTTEMRKSIDDLEKILGEKLKELNAHGGR